MLVAYPLIAGWPIMSTLVIATFVAVVIVVIAFIAWGLLGPERPSDRSGPHVDLAEQTRQRDQARASGGEDHH
jgi:hypothetical protein